MSFPQSQEITTAGTGAPDEASLLFFFPFPLIPTACLTVLRICMFVLIVCACALGMRGAGRGVMA
jgi:hypothetical protein